MFAAPSCSVVLGTSSSLNERGQLFSSRGSLDMYFPHFINGAPVVGGFVMGYFDVISRNPSLEKIGPCWTWWAESEAPAGSFFLGGMRNSGIFVG